MNRPDFVPFPKLARLNRTVIITEKLDGTNAQVWVGEDGTVAAASRTRWITPENDNFGFAGWVRDHAEQLRTLGPGHHYGEWWGVGIQRGYGLYERRFSLFNTGRWNDLETRPPCCGVVPTLATHILSATCVAEAMERLRTEGSVAAPGFMKPEGIVVFHTHSRQMFKITLEGDEHKGRDAQS